MIKDILFGLGFYATLLLIGCSAEYHFRKFTKKGGEITPSIEVVEFTDTIKVNGKDSIILVKVPVTCPELKVPETRWRTRLEYRYKYKVHRDTIRLMRTETKYKYKERKAEIKEANRRLSWFWFILIGFILNWVVRNVWFYLINRI